MGIVIGIILAIIALLITGLILRKKVYDQVNRLETWKVDVMNRDVAGELSRIKELNLSGDTQMKFESWKERWDHIVGKELVDIENQLLEAEKMADRFRVSKGKKILKEAEVNLQSIEKSIDFILTELNELLDSANEGIEEAETVEPTIKGLRKSISQHRYQYGRAEDYFERLLEKVREDLGDYYEEADSGNYLDALQIVQQVKEELSEVEKKIKGFPEIYKRARQEVPSQVDNLLSGLKEMRSDGYYIDHLNFDSELRTYQEKLPKVIRTLEEGKIEEGKQALNEIEKRISKMYELLEDEAIAKNYLDRSVPSYQEAVAAIERGIEDTYNEVSEIQHIYYVDGRELDKLYGVTERVEELKKELNAVLSQIETNSAAHTEMRGLVEQGLREIDKLERMHQEFREKIHTLRKDELEAEDKLASMHEQFIHLQRKLERSNIPGVPSYIWTGLEDIKEKNHQVMYELEQVPLDTVALSEILGEADRALTDIRTKVDKMLEYADLTEQVIQYANRYRKRYPLLAADLAESERLFRLYEYESSYEKASKALEDIEPGAIKRIKQNRDEQSN